MQRRLSVRRILIRLKRIAIGLFVGLAACLVLWLLVGRERIDRFISEHLTKPWAVFEVPSRPLPLEAEVLVGKNGLTLCNRGSARWSDVLVRISDRVSMGDAEPLGPFTYLSRVKTVEPSGCVEVPWGSFFSPGWKKIPAPRKVNISQVEILASVSGKAYIKRAPQVQQDTTN